MPVGRKARVRAAPQTCLLTRRGAHRSCDAADGRQIAFAGGGLMNSPG